MTSETSVTPVTRGKKENSLSMVRNRVIYPTFTLSYEIPGNSYIDAIEERALPG